jgi:hypothetical protein
MTKGGKEGLWDHELSLLPDAALSEAVRSGNKQKRKIK